MATTYDLGKLLQLTKDFYSLTGVKCCIYDRNENELCFYPEKLSSFCRLLREDPDMDAKCRACDRHGFSECRKSQKQYAYTCHAGLIECVSPIIHNGSIIGYLVIGQVKSDNAQPSLLPQEVIKDERLYGEYSRLPIIPMDKINSSIRLMDACTGYEYLRRLAATSNEGIDVRIAEYIKVHLTDDLSVRALCAHFRISHNEIYSIFKDYYDTTPAAYVKNARLTYACELLRSMSLSVCDGAEKCGIPDYNYFSKQFKATFGTSPTRFKKL